MVSNASVTGRHLFPLTQAFHATKCLFRQSILCPPPAIGSRDKYNLLIHARSFSSKRTLRKALKATTGNDAISSANSYEDGVSLGTMKLPVDTDLAKFETLLFQVDKIAGGARLGFITIGDGKTEVLVYIDCLVFPATDSSGPIFRAIRNGPLKAQSPPGEPRIMRSLLAALQKSVEIARV
ncbi:uncharacterized protein [Coffea arabica]|uniref:Uncharacterized protein isoform X2 n=1 Tax=Coffea arabica TaxID=13443 RepID=A0A6P6SJJ2_COFAR